MLWHFVLSKNVLVEEWAFLEKNIVAEKKQIIISSWAIFSGDINLVKWNIIIKDSVQFFWDIILGEGNIEIGEKVIIKGNISTHWWLFLWASSHVVGDIDQNVELYKNSDAKISGKFPLLFVTSNYPDFLRYFWAIPHEQKEQLWYIYLTSANMDIRWKDIPARNYYKAIYYYQDKKLQKLDLDDSNLLQKHYENSKKYINKISENRVPRYAVAFTTLPHSFDRKKADIYISSQDANADLFVHEFGHVQDFAYNYIDYHLPVYPYDDKKDAITQYGAFHKWEDFAEWYRYYFLHNNDFQEIAKKNKAIQKKYDYFKKEVFHWKEYLS